MKVPSKLAAVALAAALALGLAACSPAEEAAAPSPTATTATPTPTEAPAAEAPVPAQTYTVPADAPALPEGYSYPTMLDADVPAVQWWWCSQLDAAWEAYFNRNDDEAALGYLRAAADVDPGSYGPFDQPANALPLNRKIDRDVRYIDGGVDSQYVEYTAQGCWDWAKSVGAEFAPLS